ncbi:MAG TPA: hypothetical protein VFM55_03525 [Micromonosporaceae bacterium]|nr:hypothetical protein [Micromonosporaceae bacterium]
MRDRTDGPSFEDQLAVPARTAEVLLAPGALIHADWRTNGIPLLTTETTGCLPVLEVSSGRNRVVIGFGPHEVLGCEHAAVADQLASAAGALAVEVGLLARGKTIDSRERVELEMRGLPRWTIHVHLRPGQTKIRMAPCEGDMPWLDILGGEEALCSVSFDVDRVEELELGHLAIAGELAAQTREFALRVRGAVDVAGSEPRPEN